MNRLAFGLCTVAPDAYGFGRATVGDAERRFYADPTRFTGVFAPPRVALYHDTVTAGREWVCLYAIGRGAPTYSFSGG
jgi:hypothetical protein